MVKMKQETRKELQQKNKEKKKFKKGYEPFPEQEARIMQLGINQIIQKRDSEMQELMTEKAGLDEMDKEVQVNIDAAALKVKAAKMDLASLLFDQKYEITIHKHKNRVVELEQEIATKNHNIEVFRKQLEEGRQIRKKTKDKAAARPEEKVQSELSEEEWKKLQKEKENE